MDTKLLARAVAAYVVGVVFVGAFVFIPAGTIRFFGGLLLIAVLFIPMFIMGIVMFVKSPSLLEKRLNSKEKEKTQKGVIAASLAMFVLGFVLAGLDFRFSWLVLPKGVQIAAAVVFLLGYAMYAEVLRENEYLSRTVEVQSGQKVIDTGLYGVVRHPMYSATILMFLSLPLVLGSLIAFVVFLIYPAVIVMRIGNEEKVLEEGLEGYSEYKKKVRYRLLPFIY